MVLSIAALLIVGYAINGSLCFLLDSFWFTAGLLLLITLSLVDQPHFSKDANVFINSITAGLSLLLVQPIERDLLFWTFLAVIAYLLISSYILMLIRGKPSLLSPLLSKFFQESTDKSVSLKCCFQPFLSGAPYDNSR